MNGGALHRFIVRYRLRDGAAGVLDVIAGASAEAVSIAIDAFGEALRSCSARPAVRTPGQRPTLRLVDRTR